MKIIGLTGAIASGKSTIANRFVEHGAIIIDSDVLAREAVQPGSPALAQIVDAFGPHVLTRDKTLDRKALAQLIFSNTDARNTVNAIVHPEVRRRGTKRSDEIRAHNPNAIVVYDIPLLAESLASENRWRDEFDYIVVASAPLELRRQRLRERGLSDAEAQARISAQMPDERRRHIADAVIDTSGSLQDTFDQVDVIWQRLGY